MKIIFLGAPGAGKGTQAQIVSKALSIPTISTGAMIREAIKNETSMGVSAKSYIEAGNLVPDDVVIGIVKERISMPDCENGFILDGFPRTVVQAQALEDMGAKLDKVVNIHVSDEDIVMRMSGRRVCPACGETYHTVHNPSRDGVKCDKCGETLSVRKDDQPEIVKSRLEVYHQNTAPLEEYYREKGILLNVEGQEELSETTKLTLRVLGIEK